MNYNILFSFAMSIVPFLTIGFVALLVTYKIYIKIRSRFNVTVNCWFCNQNSKVPYLQANCWTCPLCEQYNGFKKNGDYNREIYEQLDCSRNSERFNVSQTPANFMQQPAQNGFCWGCNEAQRMKVEKLAQFEPKNESSWDKEFKIYKSKLEDQYRLCSTCDRHLYKVLREKKKMVLGSKFLDFIIKGADMLKQPHLNQIKHANQQKKKQRLRNLIIIMSLINLYCLLNSIPSLNKDHFIKFLGEFLGHQLFVIASHCLALSKVIGCYLDAIKQHAVVTKISLFTRTIFMMLLYSMGLKMTHSSLSSLYISLSPFAILAFSFLHNVVEGFRLTRYTVMMVIWSLFAGGFIEETWTTVAPQILLIFTSLFTLGMTYTSKLDPSSQLLDITSSSFHRIYSEDYLSDEDSISMLSQPLTDSCVSMQSISSNKSSPLLRGNPSPLLNKSMITSSAFSLQKLPSYQVSPNASFYSCAAEGNQTLRPKFATPKAMNVTARQSLFGSNLDLNNRERPHSSTFGLNASVTNSPSFNNSFTGSNRSCVPFNRLDNESSFYMPVNNTANTATFFKNNHKFLVPSSHSALHSPLSISSNVVYNPQHLQNQKTYSRQNLVCPTRFSANNLTSSNTSWLSGGYFNQRQSMTEISRSDLILPTAQTLTTPTVECLSRSSSHSSGFESQNGRLNGNISRENSICPDFSLDSHHRPITGDNINSFQPIGSNSQIPLSPRPSLIPNSFNNYAIENTGIWKEPNFTYKSNNSNLNSTRSSIDSFNLCKINEELPCIKKVDLLDKWKVGQAIS